MSLIHQHSCECTNSELDLFTVPPTQTSVERGEWIEHHPISTITDHGPVEFTISGTGEDYLDLSNTYLQVKAKIVNSDGKTLTQDDGNDVGPVNLWLHSLFSQVDLSLNEKLISSSNNTYPYRAYLETLLSYGQEAKTSQLTSALWYKDSMNGMDDTLNNAGFMKRRKFTELSGVVDMMGRLHLDIFTQNKYILNGVDVKIRLVRSKPSFALMSLKGQTDYKIVLQDVALFVRKVKLNPSVQLGHIKALERGSAKYPLRRVETKIFSIPAGLLTINQENLFLGQLPKRLVIGCVDTEAFNGNLKKNPFNFKNYFLNYLSLHVGGQQIPSKPLTPNYEGKGNYTRSYLGLFNSTGQVFQDTGNDINREEFKSGYTLYCFDLTPDLNDGPYFNLVKQGNLRLELHFAKPLANTVNVICYAEFDNILHIDKNKNVIFDYST